MSGGEEDTRNPKDIAGSKKLPLELLPPVAQAQMALALADGAKKYGRYNWRRKKILYSEYISALKRHLLLIEAGNDFDIKSKLHHLAHLMATSGIVLDASAAGTLIDDRVESPHLQLLLNYHYPAEEEKLTAAEFIKKQLDAANAITFMLPETPTHFSGIGTVTQKETTTDDDSGQQLNRPCVCGAWPTGQCDDSCDFQRQP